MKLQSERNAIMENNRISGHKDNIGLSGRTTEILPTVQSQIIHDAFLLLSLLTSNLFSLRIN